MEKRPLIGDILLWEHTHYDDQRPMLLDQVTYASDSGFLYFCRWARLSVASGMTTRVTRDGWKSVDHIGVPRTCLMPLLQSLLEFEHTMVDGDNEPAPRADGVCPYCLEPLSQCAHPCPQMKEAALDDPRN